MNPKTVSGLPRALIVEDDRDYSSFLVQLFSLNGFQASAAFDFESAAALASDLTPDIITLDIQLGGQSGLFLFHRLRSFPGTSETPIIVITGLASRVPEFEQLLKEVMENGEVVAPSAYIEKPLDGPELIRLARSLIGTIN
jgi:DNA-binding response OmpR family regulator